MHLTYYNGIERGVRNVALVNIEEAAKGLKKSPQDLFARVQTKDWVRPGLGG